MIVKTETIGDRFIVHERSHYELVIARAVENDALCIALLRIDDDISRLAPGILCAKLYHDVTMDQAEMLLNHLNEVVECWEMKWEPGSPGGRRDSNIVVFKRAA